MPPLERRLLFPRGDFPRVRWMKFLLSRGDGARDTLRRIEPSGTVKSDNNFSCRTGAGPIDWPFELGARAIAGEVIIRVNPTYLNLWWRRELSLKIRLHVGKLVKVDRYVFLVPMPRAAKLDFCELNCRGFNARRSVDADKASFSLFQGWNVSTKRYEFNAAFSFYLWGGSKVWIGLPLD